MAAESAAIRHAWQRQSKLQLDEHDSGKTDRYIHDAQVSGKADRYSARMTAAEQAAIRHAFQITYPKAFGTHPLTHHTYTKSLKYRLKSVKKWQNSLGVVKHS